MPDWSAAGTSRLSLLPGCRCAESDGRREPVRRVPAERYQIWYNATDALERRDARGHLWEIRLKGKAGIARALYVTANAQRVVIVRAFIKKTGKTPAGEIELAFQRAKVLNP